MLFPWVRSVVVHQSGACGSVPGREYKELARNTLERVYATPVSLGERMDIRGKMKMWCLGE